MTNMTRSSTLSLRRPAAAALTTSRPAKSVTTAPADRHAGNGNNAAPAAETTDRVLRSDALLQGRSHVSIVHNGETYQLRATRLGKLILTK
ncbi:hemin uptake protein HemP [Burkholderia sp. Ac-20365]|uniref:hemin uptake protein HemP n=1 Tax=Burkholderia sp. Ac-20365 TaxID=2703897 RepID=UPI00197BC9DF|nr:hemin uptake protein HemP [Burkholderia sp. Ac-20365]MBN3763117.1 hemin uptake protein HemP [Burkholderia sp. Ac-20365]